MKLVEMMYEGTMRAAVAHALRKGIQSEWLQERSQALNETVKGQIKAGWDAFMDEVRDVLESSMGEPMYRQVLNVQMNVWGVGALKEIGGVAE